MAVAVGEFLLVSLFFTVMRVCAGIKLHIPLFPTCKASSSFYPSVSAAIHLCRRLPSLMTTPPLAKLMLISAAIKWIYDPPFLSELKLCVIQRVWLTCFHHTALNGFFNAPNMFCKHQDLNKENNQSLTSETGEVK